MNKTTYTFSRALHMMRYGGSIMQPIVEPDCCIYKVVGIDILWKINENWNLVFCLSGEAVMGSWIEVKQKDLM